MMKSIYKSPQAKIEIMSLYDKKLQSFNFPIEEKDIHTSFGTTRVVVAGNPKGKPIVFFHGVHAGAPLTLESVKGLLDTYQLFGVETIGQATKSAENTMNIKDDSFAVWSDEVLQGLAIEKADFIGISYGAFILQKLITFKPSRVGTCILIVPSGLANGRFWPSLVKLTLPLIRYHITKKDKDLFRFTKNFIHEDDSYMFDFQKLILTGLNMDYRRPQILRSEQVEHFNNPVYIIAADNDVFFPAEKAINQAKKTFKNLKEVYIIKDCKHMPHGPQLTEIQNKIKEWVM